MSDKLKQLWARLTGRAEPTAFYPEEEPPTRSERASEILGEGKAPLDDHPSGDWARQQPFQ